MQSSTISPDCQVVPNELTDAVADWGQLLAYLPPSVDLEESARASGALVRRREVKTAADLLRLVLGYSVGDLSLRLLAAWALLWGVGDLSKTACRNRLRACNRWLGGLIVAMLQARSLRFPVRAGIRLRLIDGTVINAPGSRGTDWRLHLKFDLGALCLTDVEVTDAHGAENLARFPVEDREVVVADRGYAYANGLAPVLAAGGQIVVRVHWQNLRLLTPDGRRFDMAGWLSACLQSEAPSHECAVGLPAGKRAFALRLIAARLPAEKVAEALKRAGEKARKKKRHLDARTCVAAHFLLVLTNLAADSWPTAEVVELYRLRWQVEMLIKRLKSILHFDDMRAKDPLLAQTYLFGKLLGALLQDMMNDQLMEAWPAAWNRELTSRPLSRWRVMCLLHHELKALIWGPRSFERVCQALPRLGRFLRDEPRSRPSQLACAQARLHALSSC